MLLKTTFNEQLFPTGTYLSLKIGQEGPILFDTNVFLSCLKDRQIKGTKYHIPSIAYLIVYHSLK